MYKYSVQPLQRVRGYCPTKCKSLESALSQCEYLERNTPLCWAVVPLTEDAEKEYDEFING